MKTLSEIGNRLYVIFLRFTFACATLAMGYWFMANPFSLEFFGSIILVLFTATFGWDVEA